MMLRRIRMKVHFHGRDVDTVVELKPGSTVRAALSQAGILPSMVIVSHDDTVLPHATTLKADVALLVTTISSGG
jgi:sulfur carrier protein ThiS